MSRLVLNVVDDAVPPSILGLSTSLNDIALVYGLNATFGWGLRRYDDHKCVQPPLISYHAIYRAHIDNLTISLLWNDSEKTQWIQSPPLKTIDLFSNEESLPPPKRPIIHKPSSIHAVLVIDPEVSPQELVILQRQLATLHGVVGQRLLPWSTLREREYFLLEPLNDEQVS